MSFNFVLRMKSLKYALLRAIVSIPGKQLEFAFNLNSLIYANAFEIILTLLRCEAEKPAHNRKNYTWVPNCF